MRNTATIAPIMPPHGTLDVLGALVEEEELWVSVPVAVMTAVPDAEDDVDEA